MTRILAVGLGALLLGCAPDEPSPMPIGEADRDMAGEELALATMAEADAMAEGELWPGFDPGTTPVAIYTGESTLLFRHPAPPEGFRELAGHPGAWTYAGRHPAMVANTSTQLGDVATATILLDGEPRPVRRAAGLVTHELFHAFQRERHPEWTANEGSLFTYPVDAVEPLALRRLETEALRRALTAADEDQARCWARSAADLRGRRFGALPAEAAEYERRTELNEGLARYTEHRATGEDVGDAGLPEGGFPPADVRQRGYASGLAWALLLDRFAPDWKRALAEDADASLDGLLAEALSGTDGTGCGFAAGDHAEATDRAADDVAALRADREERLRAFQERGGWRIVVDAGGAPLFPQGFDPLNVDVVGPGMVLHDRLLDLGGGGVRVQVLGRASLTTAAGEHPLFNGVRSVMVTGLVDEPAISRADGTTRIQGEGVEIEFTGGEAKRTGKTIEVVIDGSGGDG